jgi:hypothetical protein
MGEDDVNKHGASSCWRLREMIGREYGEIRRWIRYERNSCCFGCSLPGDWCEWYRRQERCVGGDCVIPVVLGGWGWVECQEVVKRAIGGKWMEMEEYIEQLGGGRRIFGTKGSVAMGIFSKIVEWRQKRQDNCQRSIRQLLSIAGRPLEKHCEGIDSSASAGKNALSY